MFAGALLATAVVQDAGASASSADSLDLAPLLESYNARVEGALRDIDSLVVRQEMFEPQADGSELRATAILSYKSGEEMIREVLSSDLAHPAGQYRLSSLVGPVLDEDEYVVRFEGVEEVGGHECYRLAVGAIARDADHFDGTVWVSTADASPVRIVGEVADPPFPVVWIHIDKTFERHASGLWLLYRHTGEVEVSVLFVKKKGLRHIFYEDYEVGFARGRELDY